MLHKRLYTLLFLSQDCNTVEPTSKSYLPGSVARHLQDSGHEDRALKTQLIQRISSISLFFSIFSSFCLSQFSLFQLIFFILLLYFQSRTPLVKILKAEGIPVYRHKQKAKAFLDSILTVFGDNDSCKPNWNSRFVLKILKRVMCCQNLPTYE